MEKGSEKEGAPNKPKERSAETDRSTGTRSRSTEVRERAWEGEWEVSRGVTGEGRQTGRGLMSV